MKCLTMDLVVMLHQQEWIIWTNKYRLRQNLKSQAIGICFFNYAQKNKDRLVGFELKFILFGCR